MTESSENRDPRLQGEAVSLTEIVRFFQRRALLIFGTGLATGAVTIGAILLFLPHIYEASAMLIIVPSRFSSDLKPQTLTVQGYQKLLESDAAVADTKRRLVDSGTLEPDERLRLGHELDTQIFVSRRSEETELAPMIVARARTADPDTAAELANAWAEVFLELAHELMGGTTSATVRFIDEQYPLAKQELIDLENKMVLIENGFQERFDSAETRRDKGTAAFKNGTSKLVADYQAETRRLLEEFIGNHTLGTRSTRLDALRKVYQDLQDQQARVQSELEQKRLQLEAAKHQLEVTPRFLTLRKAITDEALWEAVAASGKSQPDWENLRDTSLTTQEINPVHTELSLRAAMIEMELNALLPRAKQLDVRLAAIAEQMKGLDRDLRADNALFEKLERERAAGLEILNEDRSFKLAVLERQKKQELEEIAREWTTHVTQLDREITQQKKLFEQLAMNYNEATLAKAEQNVEDVRLGARAIPPDDAEPRRLAMKFALGVLVGCAVGLLAALFMDAARP